MRKQSIGPVFTRDRHSLGNTHCPLPDRPSIRDLKNLRSGIEEAIRVSKVNIGADMVNPKIFDRESPSKVEFSGYCLARLQMESMLRNILPKRREKMPGIGIHFKTKPALAFSVGKLEGMSSQVSDLDRGQDRLVGHVLKPLQI